MDTAVSDRVKPSFVIFDIQALWRSALSVRVSGCQKLQMTAWSGLTQVFYRCGTHYDNSGRQRVKHRDRQEKRRARVTNIQRTRREQRSQSRLETQHVVVCPLYTAWSRAGSSSLNSCCYSVSNKVSSPHCVLITALGYTFGGLVKQALAHLGLSLYVLLHVHYLDRKRNELNSAKLVALP